MQAVLILAHKNENQVFKLAKLMSSKFEVYIHFDVKYHLAQDQLDKFKANKIKVFSVYDVKWGSFSILKATFLLLKEALKNKKITYFHLISGQDWPMTNLNKLYKSFEDNNTVYLNYSKAKYKKAVGEPEILWVKYYYNYDQINRRTGFGKIYHRFLLLIETILRINKLKKFGISDEQIYSGQEWFDVPRDVAEYLINVFEKNETWEKIFSTSFCSDEMFIPTILCNSSYVSRIDKNIHRYILPVKRHGSLPSILDVTDFRKIKNGNYWWGRKIEGPYSDELVDKINKEIL